MDDRDQEALKRSFRESGVSRILAENDVELAEFERYLDLHAKLDRGRDPIDTASIPDFVIEPWAGEPKVPRNVDGTQIESDLSSSLSGMSITGYSVRMRRRGATVFTLNGGSARIAPDTNPLAWDTSVKMHVASVSKLVTAMAVTKLLHDKHVDADTPIVEYLPAHFRPHASTKALTFRHLLTHRGGFRGIGAGGTNDGYTYDDFKAYYQGGVAPSDIGTFRYHNGYSIGLRIAIPILAGVMDRHRTFDLPGFEGGLANDRLWDLITIENYVKFVSKRIFAPAGVTASLHPEDTDSLAYTSSLAAPGEAVDTTPGAGTDAWWLSVDDVLAIMAAYRHSDDIVPRQIARQALGLGFGLDAPKSWGFSGETQDVFTKSGYWDFNGAVQQTLAVFAPDDTELVAFINSPTPSGNVDTVVSAELDHSIA